MRHFSYESNEPKFVLDLFLGEPFAARNFVDSEARASPKNAGRKRLDSSAVGVQTGQAGVQLLRLVGNGNPCPQRIPAGVSLRCLRSRDLDLNFRVAL